MNLVSIITPLYNSAQFIGDTIRSVQAQSFDCWEMIIVDDCSTDDSSSIVRLFSDRDPRIKLIQLTENSGPAVARNTAIEAARGRYIAFLDSDDLWLPNKLENQLMFMKENDIVFSYSAYYKINESGEPLDVIGVPERVSYNDLLKCCVIGCLTAMYDTQKIGKVYMPLIRKRQDLALWLRLLKKTSYAYGINEPLAQYRIRSGSLSSKKSDAAAYMWRLFRQVEHLSLMKSIYYFSHYAVRGVLRHKFPGIARKLGVLD